jgi:hypothetical protein
MVYRLTGRRMCVSGVDWRQRSSPRSPAADEAAGYVQNVSVPRSTRRLARVSVGPPGAQALRAMGVSTPCRHFALPLNVEYAPAGRRWTGRGRIGWLLVCPKRL